MKKDEVISDLRKKGHRLTRAREALVALFAVNNHPLSASEVLQSLVDAGVDVNKTTVYREVDFLLGQNLIHEVDLGDGQKRYESALREHHHHLVCTNCQSIEDIVVDNELEGIEKRVKKDSGFEVTRHSLEFFGICVKCK